MNYMPKRPLKLNQKECEHFPKMPIFNTPEQIEKFNLDTLFFLFYYQQGSYQQYLAGKALKQLNWRYHKKYLTWFQRDNDDDVVL